MKFRLKLFFFTQYFSVGLIGPYLVLFLIEKNFSGAQIGILMGMMPIAGMFFQPVWSYLSDVMNKRRILIVFASLGLIVASLGMGFADSFIAVFGWVVLFSAMYAPISPIATASALDYLESIGAVDDFGTLRMWGSVGFAVSSVLMGALFLDQILLYFPWFAGGIFLTLALVGLLLPEARQPYTYTGFKDLRLVVRGQQFITFLFASVFLGATMGIYNNYMTLFLQEIDTASWLIGVIISLQAIVEVPMMMLAPYLLKRVAIKWLLLAGAVAFLLRWLLYSFIRQPAWIVPTQILNGVGVFSFFVVGVAYVDRLVDPKWRATGQALYGIAMMSIGSGLGIYSAGLIIERYGVSSVWVFNSVLGLVALGLYLVSFSLKKIPEKRESSSM